MRPTSLNFLLLQEGELEKFCEVQQDSCHLTQLVNASQCTGGSKPPAIPISVAASRAVLSAHVKWVQPAVRGVEIWYFTVTASTATTPSAVVVNVTAPTTDCDIRGLSADSVYEFTVTATSMSGLVSRASQPSDVVIPCATASSTAPDPPSLVTSSAKVDALLVTWQPPMVTPCSDGPLAFYNVSVIAQDVNVRVLTIPALVTSYLLTNLSRADAVGYSFQVTTCSVFALK
jgi:hypothetical protein